MVNDWHAGPSVRDHPVLCFQLVGCYSGSLHGECIHEVIIAMTALGYVEGRGHEAETGVSGQ